MNEIIKGDYKNEGARITRDLDIMYLKGWTNFITIPMTNETISKVSVLDHEERKSLTSTISRGLLGGFLLGGVGLLGGVLTGKSKNSYLVKIQFKDGKESIAEVDRKIFRKMQIELNEVM